MQAPGVVPQESGDLFQVHIQQSGLQVGQACQCNFKQTLPAVNVEDISDED